MNTLTLFSKIELLPKHLKKQVLDYIEFLLSREPEQPAQKESPKFKPGFGGAKGLIVLSPDWDEPLADFKDYVA